ncbi:K(+)/H(+) antiporter NhaP2 [Nocardioides dokdonensis FR1436]|uniref:K(+)/H(+) antiporter NhaP2 n=1 Tax=Nocardioides dokdonensis FR1436 TaxID=1300347 RepID=A0A1A9GKR1_9ACTN|nr:cation:proton antiporter [Nocardioides dokdonensis]ANH38676.1 K(+)/H(+) antiporter NhaP2 [Nocardioides dokdonensis FR1436]
MTADLVYLVAGASLLLAIVLPSSLSRLPLTSPMVLVAVGMLLGATSLPDDLPLSPQDNRAAIEHITEITVLVALMGVGLALDRPFDPRQRASRRAWSPTWRLLAIAMPLSIAGVALLGWWAGLAPAVAILLGAVLAPTDPVLASDVQVGGPATHALDEVDDCAPIDEDDEVRFALTAEAGLNDGLAFPFVYLAVLVAGGGALGATTLEWLGWYLLGKTVIGVVVGVAVGWVLARLAFRASSPALRVADRGEPLLAVAALATSYGAAEALGGYGFLAVFACAMTFRASERRHDYHRAMHEVVERLERLLTLFVLLVLGIALTRGLLEALDWRGVTIGLGLVLVIRPLAAYLALSVLPVPAGERGGLTRAERSATAFFGVRGVGSLFYLAYAAGQVDAFGQPWLWSTVGFTIVASVLVHGAASGWVMKRLEGQPRVTSR